MRRPTSSVAHSLVDLMPLISKKAFAMNGHDDIDSIIVYCDCQRYYDSLLIVLDCTNMSTVNFYVVHCVVAFQITISLLFLPVGSLLKRKTGLSIGKALAKCFL